MLNSAISSVQSAIMAVGLAVLLAIGAIAVVSALAPLLRKKWMEWASLGFFRKAVTGFLVVAAIVYGGTKVRNAGADEDVGLVKIEADYDEDSGTTAVVVSYTNSTVTVSTPVSVRNNDSETWAELAKDGAAIELGVTNTLSFSVSGNVATNVYWWVGTDTPAVIVEVTGITITSFVATSSSVSISWTCDDPNATLFEIQRRRARSSTWETVGTTSETHFVHSGFTVGETWVWRVSSTYMEGNE